MKKFAVVLSSVLVLGLSSCSSINEIMKDPLKFLAGQSFNIESLFGKGLNVADFAGGIPSINFGELGKISGFTGCNDFTGSAIGGDGGKLGLDLGALTKKACPGNGEKQFLDAAKQVEGVKLEGEKIKLTGDSGKEVMSLVKKPA
ncbi:META domain-containing protein [bacterium]|nr:META domain-containing protein [bacterium]